jgi:hypothetical protein
MPFISTGRRVDAINAAASFHVTVASISGL